MEKNTAECKSWVKNGHPVGVIPSPRVYIPSSMPLNKQTGKLECMTCHVIKKTGEAPAQIALRVENVNSSFCKICHNRQNYRQSQQQQPEVHVDQFDFLYEQMPPTQAPAPVNWKEVANHLENEVLEQPSSQILKAGGKFGEAENGQKMLICETCHRSHNAWSDALLVINNSKSQLCVTCHSKQSADSRNEASLKGTHPINIEPDKDILAGIKSELIPRGRALSPNGTIVCTTCHQLHEAPIQTKLLPVATASSLCSICHEKKSQSLQGTKHDLSISAPMEKNFAGQTAEQSGICGACHLVHNGQGAKIWAKKIPRDTEDSTSALCLSCHSSGNCASKNQVGQYTHPVGVSISNADGNLDQLPLFNKNGIITSEALITCATCHDAHNWKPSQQFGGSNDFLRRDNADSELCLGCHKQMAQIAESEHDPHTLIYENFNLEKGLNFNSRVSICRRCHRAHNANAPMLWSRELGPGEDLISKICTSCHDAEKVAQNKQIDDHSHPTMVSINNLGENVSTSLPLFTKTYKKDPRGNVLCNSCHNTHQRKPSVESTSKKEAAKDENTNLFLRLTANDADSTLCISCHQDKNQIKGTKHDLIANAPLHKDAQGKTAHNAGLCGACHSSHNNTEKIALWNLKLGKGDDLVSQMCNSCHSDPEADAEQPVKQFTHPLNVSLAKDMQSKILPTFDRKLKPSKQGMILCSTCHSTHSEGSPLDIAVNNNGNNFLRLPDNTKLCEECHKSQSVVEGTDHDLRITAPNEPNLQGKTASESGVCGACHLVHRTPNQYLLWARELSSSYNKDLLSIGFQNSDPKTSLGVEICNSCHMAGKCAENKEPEVAFHPGGIFIPQKESINIQEAPNNPLRFYFYGAFDIKLLLPKTADLQLKFPVVDQNGRPSATGNIVCITCHNVHQWSARKNAPGKNQNLEGKETDSFLRKNIAMDFCADCHSQQSLYLFSYYHKPIRGGMADSQIFGYRKLYNNISASPTSNDVFSDLIFRPSGNLTSKCTECHNKFDSLKDLEPYMLSLNGSEAKISRQSGKTGGDEEIECYNFHSMVLEKYNAYILNKDLLPKEDNPEGVCFKCHSQKDFEKLNPHQNQLKEDGSLNRDLCLLCHYETPDPQETNFRLIGAMETYCIGCHYKKTENHPAKSKHFGKKLYANAMKQWEEKQKQELFLPLQKNKIVCSTCHNSHQAGVLQNEKTKKGADQTHRLRASLDVLCSFCHDLPGNVNDLLDADKSLLNDNLTTLNENLTTVSHNREHDK